MELGWSALCAQRGPEAHRKRCNFHAARDAFATSKQLVNALTRSYTYLRGLKKTLGFQLFLAKTHNLVYKVRYLNKYKLLLVSSLQLYTGAAKSELLAKMLQKNNKTRKE